MELEASWNISKKIIVTEGFWSKVISNEVLEVCVIVLICGVYEVIGAFGIITNIINMTVFYKTGLSDTVNFTFFCLAVSDFGGLLFLCWMGVCYNPLFQALDLSFYPLDLVYLSGGRVKLIFSRVSSVLTALITFERCLCIVFPIQIKSMLTSRRVRFVVVATIIIVVASIMPMYTISWLDWTWVPERNRTILRLQFSDNRFAVSDVVQSFGFVYAIGSFLVTVICTIVLVVQLEKKSKWRFKARSGHRNSTYVMSAREKSVCKTVVLISVVFIGCFLPTNISTLLMIFVKEFNTRRAYHNLFTLTWICCHILEALNGSVNIFIYIRMSSKYRLTFRSMCFGSSQKSDDSVTPKPLSAF